MIVNKEKKSVATITEILFIVFVFIVILVALYPKDMLKKQILAENANYDLSMLYLKNLIKHNPNDESLMLILAQQSIKSGKRDLAIRLTELLYNSKNPKMRKKALLLGYSLDKQQYFAIEDPKRKQKELQRLRGMFLGIVGNGIYKEDLNKWYKEAEFLQMPKQELKIINEMLAKDDHHIILLRKAFYLARKTHKDKEALTILQKLKKYDYRHKDKWIMQEYYILTDNKEFQKAEKLLTDYGSSDPKFKELLANLYLYEKKYKQAADLYFDLYQNETDQKKKFEYFKKSVNTFVAARERAKAVALLKEYEDQFIDNKEMREYIIKNYLAAGDLNAANAYAKRILKRKYGL